MKDPYSTLGIPKDATADQIRKAYRKLSRKYHPDVSKEPDREAKIREINEAWAILGDGPRRLHYDSTGSDKPQSELETNAKSWISQRFSEAVDQDVAKPVEHVHQALVQNMQNLATGIHAAQQKKAALEKQRTRVRRKAKKDGPSDAHNLMYAVVDEKILNVTRAITQMMNGQEILSKVHDLLMDYEDVPETATQPVGTYTFFIR